MVNKFMETDNRMDDHVDEEIKKCFDENHSTSFFMFAGAGSGKTRSLVNTLKFLAQQRGTALSTHSKQIAVITYTNAACDEISRRIEYNSLFAISTIHSFLWELIKYYQTDIREWLKKEILDNIKELNEAQSKGNASTKIYKERAEKIIKNSERLSKLDHVKRFSYNPNGENIGYDFLNHAEVIKMGSGFIANSANMQKILVSRYPILLIDESQDTKKELIDALLLLYDNHKANFIIGMFGDTMQKIYLDGKDNLAGCIPDEWKKPVKIMNHRSGTRIVELANAIRKNTDGQKQRARSDAENGTVRLFIVNSLAVKSETEIKAAEIMAGASNDEKWLVSDEYKSLILEHHMAASRLGFAELYEPLSKIDSFDTSLRDGTLPELAFLSNIVYPLIKAHHEHNDFEISKIVRQYSPLLDKKAFTGVKEKQTELIKVAEKAADNLCSLWSKGKIPTCIEIMQSIQKSGLFKITERMEDVLETNENDATDEKISALKTALSVPFSHLEKYAAYVKGNTRFATHQGIKGLEFPRVMVIMDDESSRANFFSYEKLFGAKDKTKADIDNEKVGRDSSFARTMRLFYVTCTRAQKSLGIIAYTNNVAAVKNTALANGWFLKEEVIVL